MTGRNESLKILVINNAEKGINQFTQPIVHILNQARVSSTTAEYKEIPNFKEFHGIFLSGSPRGNDIVDHHQPWFQWIKTCDIPIFGFCAGHHIIGKTYGAQLLRSVEVEVGDSFITLDLPHDPLFKGCENKVLVRQDHHDSITLPPGFILLAHSDICKVEAMKHPTKPIYTTQFHPEILNKDMVFNFIDIVKAAAKDREES